MPQTRSGRQVGAANEPAKPKGTSSKATKQKTVAPDETQSKQRSQNAGKIKSTSDKDRREDDKENADPSASSARKKQDKPGSEKKPKKRMSEPSEKTDTQPEKKQKQKHNSGSNDKTGANPHNKPRLTTPDLEFDFDRSQLRDPRPTPGREARPRYEELDLDLEPDQFGSSRNEENREVALRFENDFYVPQAEKPKGRLNAWQKNELFREQALLDPRAAFHDLYVCHKKGPQGSPTYDDAGFQLDYAKVDDWMKPQAYNKNAMVTGMEKSLERKASIDQGISDIFFDKEYAPGEDEDYRDHMWYVKDQISKDINVTWHAIGVQEAEMWLAKGFKPVRFKEWWKKPTEVEEKRMMKMLGGASLRKGQAKV